MSFSPIWINWEKSKKIFIVLIINIPDQTFITIPYYKILLFICCFNTSSFWCICYSSVCKTDRSLTTRTIRHGTASNQVLFQDLHSCQFFLEMTTLLTPPYVDNDIYNVDLQSHIANAVFEKLRTRAQIKIVFGYAISINYK